MNPALRAVLVCPIDHGGLRDVEQTLVCVICGRAYPIDKGVPDMIIAPVD